MTKPPRKLREPKGETSIPNVELQKAVRHVCSSRCTSPTLEYLEQKYKMKCHKCNKPVPKSEVYSDYYYCRHCDGNHPVPGGLFDRSKTEWIPINPLPEETDVCDICLKDGTILENALYREIYQEFRYWHGDTFYTYSLRDIDYWKHSRASKNET